MEKVQPDGPEREPDVRHYAALFDAFTVCGLVRSEVRWTDDPATPVDCPPCLDVLARVNEPLMAADPVIGEFYAGPEADPAAPEQDWYFTFGADHTHPATGERLGNAYVVVRGTCDSTREAMFAAFGNRWSNQYSSADGAGVERFALRQVEMPAPAAPERRTVALEVLDAELRALADRPRFEEAARYKRRVALVPADARVGIVLRVDGSATAVPDVDSDWAAARHSVDVLAGMLVQACRYAGDGNAEVVMPTPDVIAALAGRPELQAWTERLQMRSSAVKVGWLAVGFTAEGAEDLITAVDDCADPDCVWHGECVTVAAGTEPVHFATWQTLPVRIPAAVTR